MLAASHCIKQSYMKNYISKQEDAGRLVHQQGEWMIGKNRESNITAAIVAKTMLRSGIAVAAHYTWHGRAL
jgi:hypothetical protein